MMLLVFTGVVVMVRNSFFAFFTNRGRDWYWFMFQWIANRPDGVAGIMQSLISILEQPESHEQLSVKLVGLRLLIPNRPILIQACVLTPFGVGIFP